MRWPWVCLVGLGVGCLVVRNPRIEVLDVNDVVVFAYEDEPLFLLHALHRGVVGVEDGCMVVGTSVVVWRPSDLGLVEEALERVAEGEVVTMELGGGETGTVDGLRRGMGDVCDGQPLWLVGDGAAFIEEPGGR